MRLVSATVAMGCLVAPPNTNTRVRLASGGLIAIVLLAPTLGATPLLTEGPVVAFGYDTLVVQASSGGWAQPSVGVHDDKIGAAWLGPGSSTEIVVRDGAMTHRSSVPWKAWVASAFDGLGRYHVFTYARNQIPGHDTGYVTTWDDGAWSTAQLDEVDLMSRPDSFVHDGVPHFVVAINDPATFGRIYRLDLDSDEWEVFAELPFSGYDMRATADSQGRVHVVGHARSASEVKYSILSNGSWTTVTAPFYAAGNDVFDVAIDDNDRAVFAYRDSLRRVHYLPPNDTGGYADELVSTRPFGDEPHVEVGNDGLIHLMTFYYTGSFNTPTFDNAYYHVRSTNGAWSSQPVLPVASQLWPDLTLDDKGHPAIALANKEVQDVVGTPLRRATQSIVVARPLAAYVDGST